MEHKIAEPYRILYFSSFGHLRYGGQKSLYLLVTHLNLKTYRPFVLVPEPGELEENLVKDNIPAVILNLPQIKLHKIFEIISALRNLKRIVKENKIHLLHTDGPRNTLYAGIVGRSLGIPVVWHIRSSDRDPYDRLLYLLCDRIILVASALRNRFSWQKDDRKFISIHNGMDLDVWDTALEKAQDGYRSRKTTNGALRLICIGRIEPAKGQLFLIEACGILHKQGIPFELVLAGEIVEDGYFIDCKTTAETLGIAHKLTISGHQKNIGALMSECDIVISPSISGEAFSRSIIEAMATRKAIIATDVGGAKEAIIDGVSGFVVPRANPYAIAEKIILLFHNPHLIYQFGEGARKYVEDKFTIKKCVEKTECLYQSLLNNP